MKIPFALNFYERHASAVSGALMTVYDPIRPQLLQLPMRDEVRVTRSATAPAAGYPIPASQSAWLAPKLRDHGIRFTTLAAARPELPLQAWRATTVKRAASTFEGHSEFTLQGAWPNETRAIPAGSLFVPIGQPKARLLSSAKEYMEPHVEEQVAQQMLKDPTVRAAFEQKLASDADFARSSNARLEFFYRRHPSWDERYNLYPVYRLDTPP